MSRWSVAAQSQDAARLRFTHDGRTPGRFPFAYEAEQTMSLSDAGLSLGIRVRNVSSHDMPAGLGLHPYFRRTPQTRLTVQAGAFWTPPSTDAGAVSPVPARRDFSGGGSLPDETLDHSYVNAKSPVEVRESGRRILMTTDAPHIHVYAPAGADFFCVEPVTHLPGRFGETIIGPGAELRLSMRIAVL